MNFWKSLDPTGSNFLGMGPKWGRIFAGINSAGGTEFHRTDPFATTPGTLGNKVGRGFGGAGPGAVGGFITGGYPGAVLGGLTGAGLGGTGTTNSTTLSGFGENFGAGMGAGLLAGYGAGTGLSYGGAGGAGSGMSAYMPTSTPNMSQAGSTLGPGGSSSPLNPMSSAMPTKASTLSKVFDMMRKMPSQNNQQNQGANTAQKRQDQEMQMRLFYEMFPALKPGASLHQGGL